MNQETNDFLKENLEEAHATFNSIIMEMRENNIDYAYNNIRMMEINSYREINELINKMSYSVIESNNLKEENSELFEKEYKLYLRYFSLYIVSLVFIRMYHEIFDTSELNDMMKYIVGMFLGTTYMGLLQKDLHDNKSDTKDKRDLINKLQTMKEEYKKNHDMVVREIDYIFALNDNLWNELDKSKMMVKQKQQ